jgi:dUTP pyrophosphatase
MMEINGREVHGRYLSRWAYSDIRPIHPIQLVRDPNYVGAVIPLMAHETDSGYDVFAMADATVEVFKPLIVPSGWLLGWLDPDYEIQIRPRSSMPMKMRCTVANTPATVDSGYRGPIGIEILYFGEWQVDSTLDEAGNKKFQMTILKPYLEIKKGEKIGQFVNSMVYRPGIVVVDKVTPSDRGAGGFGSTSNFAQQG